MKTGYNQIIRDLDQGCLRTVVYYCREICERSASVAFNSASKAVKVGGSAVAD